MLLEENRNCNNCQSTKVMQNTQMSVSMSMQNNEQSQPKNRVDCELRREMIQEIRSLDFAINELALYLDTHPEDEKALCLHRKYCKEANELKEKYQRVYGPLTINYPCNKWRWLEEPWPWERGNF